MSIWQRFTGALGGVKVKAQQRLTFFVTNTSTWLDAVWPRVDFTRLVDDGYGKHAVVFACVQWYVRTLRKAPLVVYDEDDTGERVPVADHPARKLMRRPNKHMSEREFWAYLVTYAAVGGLACIWKERDNAGHVIGLWPLHRGVISPIPDERGWLAGWSYDVGGGKPRVFLSVKDVIPFRWAIDPNNPLDAMPVLYAVARAIDTGVEAMRYVYAFLKNDATPRTALVATGLIPESVKQKMLEQYREQYGGDNRGMPMILEGAEAKLERIGSNLNELASDALRFVPDADICAGFGLPAVLIGTAGGLQRSIQGAPKELAAYAVENVAVPLWADLSDTFTAHLLPEFDGEDGGRVMAFDLTRVPELVEDKIAKRASILASFLGGLLSWHEAIIEDGRDAPDQPDVYMRPKNVNEIPAEPAAKEEPVVRLEVGKAQSILALLEAVYGKPPVESARQLAVSMGMSPDEALLTFPDMPESEPEPPEPPPPTTPFVQDQEGQMPDDAVVATDQTPLPGQEPATPAVKALSLPDTVEITEDEIDDAMRSFDDWAAAHNPRLIGLLAAKAVAAPRGKR